MFPKIMLPPNHPFVHRVFHEINHPFWGSFPPIFGSTPIFLDTLPETNIAHENPIFPGKYHQNCGFSMAMLVSGNVFFSLCSLLLEGI